MGRGDYGGSSMEGTNIVILWYLNWPSTLYKREHEGEDARTHACAHARTHARTASRLFSYSKVFQYLFFTALTMRNLSSMQHVPIVYRWWTWIKCVCLFVSALCYVAI